MSLSRFRKLNYCERPKFAPEWTLKDSETSAELAFGNDQLSSPQTNGVVFDHLFVCPSPLSLGQIDLSDFGGSGGIEDGTEAVFG